MFLALASWLGGDLQRASQLIEEAMVLGGHLGHLPDVIHALWYKVHIRCLRNDPERVAVDAENLLRTSQQLGVELFVMLADVALSWARGRLGDARSGANELRRSLAEYTSKGNRLFVPPVLALLAELESAAGDAERAQSAIDEGLTMAQEGGALCGLLPSSPPRRPPSQTQSQRSRARCSGLQVRCRGLGASGRARLQTARLPIAR